MLLARTRKVSIALGAAVLLTVTALPVAAQDEAPLLYAINKEADQQYFIDLQTSFVAQAEEMGATALTANAGLEPALGIDLVNDAISAGAAGIAITVPDQTIGPAVTDAAAAAGVAIIATDDSIVDSAGNPVPFVGFSGTDMGDKVGTEAVRLLGESGWLDDESVNLGVLVTTVETLSVCTDRTTAASAALVAAGVDEAALFTVPYEGNTQSGQDTAGPVITAHPDVTNWVVYACNDEGVLGVLNALATQGVDSANVIGVGLGAYEACKFWAAEQPSGFKSALFISGLDVGATAAQVLYEHIVNGAELPAMTIAPTTMVDASTYADVFDEISLGNCAA